MKQIVVVAVFALLASACDSGANKDAQKVAGVLTGDSKGAASDNPICKLFKPGELEAYAGEALNAGGNAGLGYACQWTAKDGEGNVMVTIVGGRRGSRQGLREGLDLWSESLGRHRDRAPQGNSEATALMRAGQARGPS